jgi:hypothetical protein
LNKAIKNMHAQNKYKNVILIYILLFVRQNNSFSFLFKMVIYIEACESGSMFDGLLADNINGYNLN